MRLLINFNCRSLHASLTKINLYLNTFRSKFKLITLSDTWLNQEKGIDFHVESYELHYNKYNQ